MQGIAVRTVLLPCWMVALLQAVHGGAVRLGGVSSLVLCVLFVLFVLFVLSLNGGHCGGQCVAILDARLDASLD